MDESAAFPVGPAIGQSCAAKLDSSGTWTRSCVELGGWCTWVKCSRARQGRTEKLAAAGRRRVTSRPVSACNASTQAKVASTAT